MGIIRVTIWIIGVVNLLTKSPLAHLLNGLHRFLAPNSQDVFNKQAN